MFTSMFITAARLASLIALICCSGGCAGEPRETSRAAASPVEQKAPRTLADRLRATPAEEAVIVVDGRAELAGAFHGIENAGEIERRFEERARAMALRALAERRGHQVTDAQVAARAADLDRQLRAATPPVALDDRALRERAREQLLVETLLAAEGADADVAALYADALATVDARITVR